MLLFPDRSNIQKTIGFYNDHILRYKNREEKELDINNFVNSDNHQISWSDGLKAFVKREIYIAFDKQYLRHSIYRPFIATFLYFDKHLNERRYQFPYISPTSNIEDENRFICVTGIGAQQSFATLISKIIPDLNFMGVGTVPQWFSFYTYDENGNSRQENITDWALEKFQTHYQDPKITKWDIFHYTYALLHHPHYRDRYTANLKRELPRIPFAPEFHPFAAAGKRLTEIHINYEQQPEYRLKHIENKDLPIDWRVEKMRLSKDKTQIKYNDFLTLTGIPPETFEYKLGNRSALDWIIDQYQVSTDKRSGITNDPNRLDDEEYIVRLIKQVITVSLETVKIVKGLPDLGLPKD